MQVEKENPNLITVFICFLRSGLRFTRYDTNNVGLAFIEEIKKHNPNFKPVKVEQRERDQTYIVNAYPKEFEQLILSLIEEYRKKHKLEYRLKKPRSGGFNRGGGNRPGGSFQSRDQRGSGSASRPRRDDQRSGSSAHPRSTGSAREGGYRPRRNYDDQQPRQDSNRPSGTRDGQGEGGYRPRREPGLNRPDGPASNPDPRDKNDDPENRRPRRPRREDT